jgi:hypothetical protein
MLHELLPHDEVSDEAAEPTEVADADETATSNDEY